MVLGKVRERTQNLRKSHRINRPYIFVRSHKDDGQMQQLVPVIRHQPNACMHGAGNAWSIMTVDTERDLVFVPTGSASPDYYGGLRPGNNKWANSVVALRGKTGEFVWGFQLVHHDLWDYDTASAPLLATVKRGGKPIPVVIQGNKTALLYVLNRDTGAPVFPVEERPVPQSDVPGEVTSPTQPFPWRLRR
jgi:quinoprotein glucose dehydrogenase